MQVPFYKYVSDVAEHSNTADVLDGEDLEQVSKLEKEFAKYVDVTFALATSSGTASLHLAMMALDLKRGDKIICSVNSYATVPEVVRHFDAEPVFIDIDDTNLNIDIDKLEAYLDENTNKKLKAVIVTLIGGANLDLKRLYEVASSYNVKVVLDASEAMGAIYEGKKIGGVYADITCFDFSPHLKKNICSGGILTTDDEEIYNRAKLLANHGIVKHQNTLDYIYDVIEIGNDYKMSELCAAYFRAGLLNLDEKIKRQKEIASIYNEELKGIEHVELFDILDKDYIYDLYIIKIDKNRDSFALDMKKLGIETGLHFIPLHLVTYYKAKYNLRISDFPKALKMYQQVLSLPIYPSMSDDEVYEVCDVIKKVAKTKV
jgi:dTDP-4-amino-4,6-dideoxygalactose transaminase